MTRTEYISKAFDRTDDATRQRIEDGIENNRKGEANIRVVDADGAPVSGVRVRARLKKHAFLHGANIFMLDELETAKKNAAYREVFPQLFNLATLPFYWSDQEPTEGKVRFGKDSERIYRRPTPDLCLEYCEEKGVTPKLHCLNYDQWTPRWVPRDVKEIKRLLEKRIREIAKRYASRIHGMEVINETLLSPVDEPTRRSTPFFGEDDLIAWSFDCARKYLPRNELIINEATEQAWDVSRGARSWYPLSIGDAMRKGATIDAIGMQFHMFYPREREEKQACFFYNPKMLLDAMDTYERLFHLPLQITEVTIPAYSNDAKDEELQAKILENLYTVWFSHPAMEAVIYWNVVDGYAAFAPQGDMTSGENYYYGGLMRFDFSKKPAFDRMQELFEHRWHTDAVAETDESGVARFRGFYGEYDVEIEKNGQAFKAAYALKKDGAPAEIRLSDR